MVHRKRARAKKTKNLPDWAKDIKQLSIVLKCDTQEEFAVKLRYKQGTVSTWLRGDEARKPSADTFVRMAGLAAKLDPELASRFLRLANISDEAISLVAHKLKANRFAESAPLVQKGDIVLIPRVRETAEGRQEAGPPVLLAREFVPHPLAAICLVVDEKSDAVVSSPRGVLILDASCEGASDLTTLWDHVVAISYAPDYAAANSPGSMGVYVGRLELHLHARSFREAGVTRFGVWLDLLTVGRVGIFPLAEYSHPSGLGTLSPDDEEGRAARAKEIENAARSEFRLPKGIRVLGRVIGRLTGHINAEHDTAKDLR